MIETTLEAHPNPANPTTTVRYAIAEPGDVSLRVHNIAGQLVRTLVDARREPGMHSVTWNARDDAGRQVASGVYLIRLTTPVETLTTRVVLVQ